MGKLSPSVGIRVVGATSVAVVRADVFAVAAAVVAVVVFAGGGGVRTAHAHGPDDHEPAVHVPAPEQFPSPDAVSPFIRRIFQDESGSFWLGTNGDGVARFDGEELTYHSIPEGFGGVAVRGIVEDEEGNVWFATSGGVTKYDGQVFLNLTTKNGLPHNDVWSIFFDSSGTLWAGTYRGACRLMGDHFVPFVIPPAEKADPFRGVSSPTLVRCIAEDRAGNMWFATTGGAYKYDGTNLQRFSTEQGLRDDSVNCILEGPDGDIWFATHYAGIHRFDGESIVHVSGEESLKGTEAWDLYLDHEGNLWFPVERAGLYRYDGKGFTNFGARQGLDSPAIQCTFQDNEGRIWAGGYLGLYRLDGGRFVNVLKDGPW